MKKLRVHSSAKFAEKDLKQRQISKCTQQFTAIAEISNARFVRKASKEMEI
jgi:hypothetical protein